MARFLENPINWSFGAGRLFGIAIRIHMLFVLGAVVVFARAFAGDGDVMRPSPVETLGQISLLFLIVLLHEFGHCFGCRSTGGTAEEILMWPLGGLATVAPPHNPRAHLITALAGPAVNVAFCVVTAVVLILWTGGNFGAVPWNPFHLFRPLSYAGFDAWAAQKWLVVFFGLNMLILLFNLAPVFPLDGGRVLQALLWPRKGFHASMMLASGVGMVGAIGFAVIGLFSGAVMLFFIAVFGYWTCWQQRQQLKMGVVSEGGEFGYDFSRGYAAFDEPADGAQARPSFWQRRRAKKQEARHRREQERVEAERRRIDAILRKISSHGIDSLTPKERQLLQRESHRQASGDHKGR
ncbi:MAG: hypothetical protein JSV19_11245 [Phycisphaerales bacterium]|nr:MAG: hypothetical protein JSV19_11245 [Phycisphaerales bacterium]